MGPRFLVANASLRRVGDYLEGGDSVWLLTHPDLKSSARVKKFLAFARQLLRRDKDLLEGKMPLGHASPRGHSD